MRDADMTIDKALERAQHIKTVTRIELEDNEELVSAIQSNENTQLVNSINHLVRTLLTNESNRQVNQKLISSQGARPKEFLRGSERSSKEARDRNRNYKSYNKNIPDNRRTSYDSRARLPTTGGENRTRDRSHESRTKLSKTAVSFEGRKCRRGGQGNHAAKECKNCFECGSPNLFKRNCPYLNEN